MDINTFKSKLPQGVLRNNRYLLQIIPPPAFVGGTFPGGTDVVNTSGLMSFLCDGATLPGVALEAAPIRHYGYGPPVKRAMGAVFNDINCTFIGDAESKSHTFFAYWLRRVFNFAERRSTDALTPSGSANLASMIVEFPQDYICPELNVLLGDETGAVKKRITCYKAFPIMIADTPLAWQQGDIVHFQVSFTFDFWHDTTALATNLNLSSMIGT